MKYIQDLKLELLPHLPYSPDFAPSDFHLVWLLTDALHEHLFRSCKELKNAVHNWLAQQPKDFFSWGIDVLLECWRRFLKHGGNYTENHCNFTISIFVINHSSFSGFHLNNPCVLIYTKAQFWLFCIFLIPSSTSALGPTQCPIKYELGFLPRAKAAEAWYWPFTSI